MATAGGAFTEGMWQHVVTDGWNGASGRASRFRVLIESSDPLAEISAFSAFREAGLEVALCSGPKAEPRECPLVRGDVCGLVDDADAVFVLLDTHVLWGQSVVQALVASHPQTPVVLACSRAAEDDGELPPGVIRLPMPASVGGQVRVLRAAAVDGRRRTRNGTA